MSNQHAPHQHAPNPHAPGHLTSFRPARQRAARSRLVAAAAALSTAAALAAVAVASPSATAATGAPATSTPTGTQPAATGDVTSPVERARVDAVPTPHLTWQDCYGGDVECTTVKLPKDYDEIDGPTVDVAIARRPADDSRHRIGTLFVNPGGPGGSAAGFAADAEDWASSTLLTRFDIVGIDPRGQGGSDRVKCFRTRSDQDAVWKAFGDAPFPVTPKEQATFVAAAADLGSACSSKGSRLAASVSTAEVARDMDVVRRALGERKLTYLGFSYGTYLGAVYANLFPDRVRALALDGVVDPTAWQGSEDTRSVPMYDRTRSGDGAWSALQQILTLCGESGPRYCRLAGLTTTPEASFRSAMAQLKARPITVSLGGKQVEITYADLSWYLLLQLYDVSAPELVDDLATQLVTFYTSTDAKARRAARRALAIDIGMQGFAARSGSSGSSGSTSSGSDKGDDKAVVSDSEGYYAVLCSDARNPDSTSAYAQDSAALDARAPYVGLPWLWSSVPCAESTWTARDEDAYVGTFTHVTAAPVLIVGNLWDPATNVAGARHLAELMPSSRLLVSDSWGHTAYGTSGCVTSAITKYLVAGRLPDDGATCTGAYKAFATKLDAARTASPQAPTASDPDADGSPVRVGPPPALRR